MASAAVGSEDEKWRYIHTKKMGSAKILHLRLSIDPGYVQSGVALVALCKSVSDGRLFFCYPLMERHDYKSLYGNNQYMSCDELMDNIVKHYDSHLLHKLGQKYPLTKIKVVIESQFDVGGQYQSNYANPSNVVAAALFGYFVGKGMEVEVVRADRKFGLNEGLGEWKPSRDVRKIVAVDIDRVLFEEWGVYTPLHELFIPPVDAPDADYKELHDVHDAGLQGADSILTDNPDIDGATHFKDIIEKIKAAVAVRRQKVDVAEAAKVRKRAARGSTQKPKRKRQKVQE